MADKKAKLQDIALKYILAKNYVKYFLESDDDIDTILDNIIKDMDEHKLSTEDQDKIIEFFGKELDNISYQKEELDIKDELIKEAQRHSETWKNVQKAKEIMKKLNKK